MFTKVYVLLQNIKITRVGIAIVCTGKNGLVHGYSNLVLAVKYTCWSYLFVRIIVLW